MNTFTRIPKNEFRQTIETDNLNRLCSIPWVNSHTDKLNFKYKFSMQIANYVTPNLFIIVQKSPKSLAAGAPPQTPLGELTALPQTP